MRIVYRYNLMVLLFLNNYNMIHNNAVQNKIQISPKKNFNKYLKTTPVYEQNTPWEMKQKY